MSKDKIDDYDKLIVLLHEIDNKLKVSNKSYYTHSRS